jgi:chemotaxis protein CheY-P-specific phosphatase CheC
VIGLEKEEVMMLTPMQLDALREIGNIGAGNAATALSQIINRKLICRFRGSTFCR